MDWIAEGLAILKEFFEREGIPYVVVGGVANVAWGEFRITRDVDVKFMLGGELDMKAFYALAASRFEPLFEDAQAFFRRNYVLSVRVSERVTADLVMAVPGYEELIFERAVTTDFEEVTIPICTAEDLIIQKGISPRERDWQDIEGILLRQGDRLDQDYILDWLRQFAEALERPELLQRYAALRAQIEALGL